MKHTTPPGDCQPATSPPRKTCPIAPTKPTTTRFDEPVPTTESTLKTVIEHRGSVGIINLTAPVPVFHALERHVPHGTQADDTPIFDQLRPLCGIKGKVKYTYSLTDQLAGTKPCRKCFFPPYNRNAKIGAKNKFSRIYHIVDTITDHQTGKPRAQCSHQPLSQTWENGHQPANLVPCKRCMPW